MNRNAPRSTTFPSKAFLDLCLRSQECTPVCGAAFINLKFWSIFDVANVALELDIGPVLGHFTMEALKSQDWQWLCFHPIVCVNTTP
jgi:hypothetical protein